MIPNGKEIIIDGHKVVFESTTYQCRGCFFENRDSCPDCDEGLWVEENPSPWHTGTPTEEGRYLTVLESPLDEPFYVIAMLRKEPNRMVWQGNIEPLAWQKIEPYEASKERE